MNNHAYVPSPPLSLCACARADVLGGCGVVWVWVGIFACTRMWYGSYSKLYTVAKLKNVFFSCLMYHYTTHDSIVKILINQMLYNMNIVLTFVSYIQSNQTAQGCALTFFILALYFLPLFPLFYACMVEKLNDYEIRKNANNLGIWALHDGWNMGL
uniref:Uncharacterized protein n=1 Tax=Anthurium amnicola TaxID=1678845 RepID=A0A1D1Z214_9ARAE